MGLDVAIIGGCGHVGLPLGMLFAHSGLQVGLLDTDVERADTVRSGRMPFLEYGADEVLAATIGKTLHVLDDPAMLAQAEYVVITVGTPIDEHLNPRFEPLFDLFTELAQHFRRGQHVVLRSTVFPGTTRELTRHLASLDLDLHLTYCPERIAQGYAMTELDKLPQIVSGYTEEAVASALALFERLTPRTIVVDVEEAELAKLFLNSWRYIQFAIANQFYMIATEHGLDYFRIHDAMVSGYARAEDYPLPGFTAGPCLLKDTMQLSAFEQNRFQLGHAAMLVNEGLAGFIVSQLAREHDLRASTVGILGMAFKGDIDDTRDSLAYKLRKLLQFHGARVLATDPLARDDSLVPIEQVLGESDILVLGAPHSAYRQLSLPTGIPMIDVWGFFPARGVRAGIA